MEKWRLKLTSAKVEVEIEAELGNKIIRNQSFTEKMYCGVYYHFKYKYWYNSYGIESILFHYIWFDRKAFTNFRHN